jgi:hypothetical protein
MVMGAILEGTYCAVQYTNNYTFSSSVTNSLTMCVWTTDAISVLYFIEVHFTVRYCNYYIETNRGLT